jgi:FlaA1/EpsC-like NDP-sugar epimerase
VDVREATKMAAVLEEFRPEIIFHAAAYKHVPLVEKHPEEGIENNFLATIRLAQLAAEAKVHKFVFISTDKAVNPRSVMGATKRAAEVALQAYAGHSPTSYITVRFGNVLASQGSVVLTFERQIEQGGPVTVTHPDMTRFFMTISEAVRLILEAARLGSGGEIFILDMGEPVRITDLARHMIRLKGYEPETQIAIVFTGIRPGEKLREELWYPDESPHPTSNPKILRARTNGRMSWPEIEDMLAPVLVADGRLNTDEAVALLRRLVPEYTSSTGQPPADATAQGASQ